MTRISGPGPPGIPPGGSQGGGDHRVDASSTKLSELPEAVRQILARPSGEISPQQRVEALIDWWVKESPTARFLPEPLRHDFQNLLHSILPDNPQVQHLIEQLRHALTT